MNDKLFSAREFFKLLFILGWNCQSRLGTDRISGKVRFRPDIRLQFPVPVPVRLSKNLPDFSRKMFTFLGHLPVKKSKKRNRLKVSITWLTSSALSDLQVWRALGPGIWVLPLASLNKLVKHAYVWLAWERESLPVEVVDTWHNKRIEPIGAQVSVTWFCSRDLLNLVRLHVTPSDRVS